MAIDEAKEFVFLRHIGAAWVDDDAFFFVVIVNDVGIFREGIEDERFELEHNIFFDAALRLLRQAQEPAQGPLSESFSGQR